MRYPAAEKVEIIRLVKAFHLPARRALDKLGIPRSTFYSAYHGFRFPAEIISHAVWLYHCFSLSLREVEAILAPRGSSWSYGRNWVIAL